MTIHLVTPSRRDFVQGAGALGAGRHGAGDRARPGRAAAARRADAADRRRRVRRAAHGKAMQAVMDEVNAAGGLLGRKVVLVIEDDQTNPEAAVRAARKLIDVTKVPAIMGTWASAVTTAVAPVCWESKTFLTTVSGADSDHAAAASGLPDPHAAQQPAAGGEARASSSRRSGAKRVFIMSIQTPFAQPTQNRARGGAAEGRLRGGRAG